MFSEKEPLKFIGIPSFAPEHFRRVRLRLALGAKHLQKGLTQLGEEGAVQLFRPLLANDFILGAVGVLQFDVTMARLKAEYKVDAVDEGVDYATARWGGLVAPIGSGWKPSRRRIRPIWRSMRRGTWPTWPPVGGGWSSSWRSGRRSAF